ncbi:hypothetical protein SanJ4211_1362c [Streptococcus anginosus]|uniref:hypothetical protein n=1 Tax=Streptococcus anginosus TaxID=1328 RepID=UPI000705A44A|nr:hypothetical protein [Streptococcus anginosus]ALL03449.1 hypothetical protein SanJ4211_1362c [Streptococcus anginosus]QBX31752.1 hypothetical protein Javan74_0016 [Streptococcus phage Javan74]
MKVRVKQTFNDWQANVRRYENEIFEMTDERFNELSHNFKSEFSVNIADVVEIIDETQAQGDETTPYD